MQSEAFCDPGLGFEDLLLCLQHLGPGFENLTPGFDDLGPGFDDLRFLSRNQPTLFVAGVLGFGVLLVFFEA